LWLCHEEAATPQISNLFQIWGILVFCIFWVLQHVSQVYVVLWFFVLSLSLSLSLTNSGKFLKICSPGKVMMLCHIFVLSAALLWPHILILSATENKGKI